MMDGQEAPPNEDQLPEDPEASQDEQADESMTYWATFKGEDLASALDGKQEDFFNTARVGGFLWIWIVAYASHHGVTPQDLRDFATQQLSFQGDELEMLRFHLNLVRSYVRQQTALTLGEPAAFKTMVVNSDHASQARAELSDRILTNIYKRYIEDTDAPTAESDGVFGSGFTHIRWDFGGGDEVQVDQQLQMPDGRVVNQPVPKRSGAPLATTAYPWQVVKETRESGEELWCLVREPESFWNVIAMFPQHKDELLKLQRSSDQYDFGQLFRIDEWNPNGDDIVTVKHFYHARCAALPEGRYAIMVGELMLWDGPSPVKEGLPVSEMRSGKYIGKTFGYADSWDYLPVNQALNQVNSDEMTNYATYGHQSIAIEKGTEVNIDAIARGTAFYVPPGAQMPKAIQLTAIPATLPTLKDYLHHQLDTMSGQNSASRGDPDPNIKSGEMQALNASIAISYQSFRQKAKRKLQIRNAQIVLDMISRYGETPFLVEITGIKQRSYVAEFTREDLSGIQRVTIDEVSPVMQSISGRIQLFTLLKDLPPEDRAAANELITTGNPDLYMEVERSADMLIRRENEDLVTGEREVVVNATDDPFKHFPKHVAQRDLLLASDNPDLQAIGRINQHLLEHQTQYLGVSPIIAGFMQIPPPPPIPPSPPGPNGEPGGPGNAAYQLAVMGTMSPQPMAAPGAPAPGGEQPAAESGAPSRPAGQPSQPQAQGPVGASKLPNPSSPPAGYAQPPT